MNSWIKSYYRELRADGVGASHALHAAKTIDRFHDLENERLVRIIAEPDETPYDPGDCLDGMSERSISNFWDMINDRGVWGVISEFRISPESPWQQADSVWSCAGYNNPTSYRENWYVPDLMHSAIQALETYDI